MEINADKRTCLLPHPSHLQPSVPKGSTSNLIGPLHPLESKLSSDLPAWNDPFRFTPHNRPPSGLVHIPTLCVYVLAQMPVISPFHICASFFPLCWEKVGKRREKKRERSENSRRYYCAACMAPVVLPFHLCFLLYWQMVVIRQYGNTVVKIVFTDFFSPLVFMTWWSSWERCGLEQRATLPALFESRN